MREDSYSGRVANDTRLWKAQEPRAVQGHGELVLAVMSVVMPAIESRRDRSTYGLLERSHPWRLDSGWEAGMTGG
ncbi:MAG: hypothetical protein ACFCVA_14490 [Gammaproteobacteria bacterium]